MPLIDDEKKKYTTFNAWDTDYKDHVNEILKCCGDPTKPNCKQLTACANSAPFGGGAQACLPPDRESMLCEVAVSRAARSTLQCILRCHRRRAASGGSEASEEECETSCLARYDSLTASLSCPSCLGTADRAALGSALENLVHTMNGGMYCAPGTPWGGDATGYLPPDPDALFCENRVARSVGHAANCILRCRQRRARGRYTLRAESECIKNIDRPSSCLSRYERETGPQSTIAPRCPPCLAAAARSALFDETKSRLDGLAPQVYCASPGGAFLDP
jgi:hypothetical protein